MLLAGDIGGTKTILGLFSPETGAMEPLAEATFPSSDYRSLEEMAAEFLRTVDCSISRACFGIAGPVSLGIAKPTNLPWDVRESELSGALGISEVSLLNDLEAMAHAVPYLGRADLKTLNQGNTQPHQPLAVIAPGTGLGEAFLTWNGEKYTAHASEGGHGDFAPATPEQTELLVYLQEKLGRVSTESVCSGIGIPNIYEFLRDSGRFDEPDEWTDDILSGRQDPVPTIINAALGSGKRCTLCEATLRMFVSILGSEAGNLALRVMALGGVFVGGGIPARIVPALAAEPFMESFKHRGQLSEMVEKIPVHIILNPKTAFIGAACYGLDWDGNQIRVSSIV